MNKNDQNVLTDTEKIVLKPSTQFSVLPFTGSKGVSTKVNPLINFKDQIQRSTMNSKNIMLIDSKGHIVPSKIETFNVNDAAIVPNEPLEINAIYRIKFGNGFRGLEGKKISITDNSTVFQTGEK